MVYKYIRFAGPDFQAEIQSVIGSPQESLPGIVHSESWFAWPLDESVGGLVSDTETLTKEVTTIKEKLSDLVIVKGVSVEYRDRYKIYWVYIKYNDPDEEMALLRRFQEIYDEFGGDNIVLDYDSIPDEDLSRAKSRGVEIIFEK